METQPAGSPDLCCCNISEYSVWHFPLRISSDIPLKPAALDTETLIVSEFLGVDQTILKCVLRTRVPSLG